MSRKKNPKISAAFLKSDNAGCYHSSQLLLILPDIGKRAGIEIKLYDSSDPQSWKDICDRKIAPMKWHIRMFINEKHDIVAAEDMKIALESNGGVKGCNFIVAEVDVSEAPEAGSHFGGVSYLNNFAYEEDSIRCWKAYKQGKGKTIKKPRGTTVTGLKIVEAQNTEMASKGKVSEQSSSTSLPYIFCQEQGCVLAFHSYEDKEHHYGHWWAFNGRRK